MNIKKRCKKIMITGMLIALVVTTIYGFSDTKIESSQPEVNEFDLSNYDYEVVFTSEKDIKKISEQYDIENPEQIEEIRYVPIELADE